ncbi:MAG: deoxyguanosinetriphosphate triphosphohydrolase [Kiritimatiellia bacterium]|nr:deoxyguanosinetriphosphate triphosphohydrolase [Kiritimatiellia bacterium]
MIQTRKDLEEAEQRSLAPYALRSSASLGRTHAEQPHEWRTDFARDRDRILHSRAFRRLEYKTQVFVNGTADHYRTRLTHTMEMAAVGRTMARALRANEDLTEAIALAHDIGHSPFGHVGEDALEALMKNEGGFDHNLQSCRAVELLETVSPGFSGLNLTWEVRAGLRKHQAAIPGAQLEGHPLGPFQSIEAQIADLCDDMAYHAHDVDDGFDAGLIRESDLMGLEIWRKARDRALAQYPAAGEEALRTVTIRNLLDIQVEDAMRTSAGLLDRASPDNPEAVRQADVRLIANSPGMKAMLDPLRAFLFEKIYFHPSVADANRESVEYMRRLFMHYIHHPETMGRKARARVPTEGLWRTACDYIAGMTDRYALEEVARYGLNDPSL